MFIVSVFSLTLLIVSLRWKTDFLIHRTDGTQAVREVVREDELTKATTLEQLELSRRYWEAVGVSDWRVALFREGVVSPAP